MAITPAQIQEVLDAHGWTADALMRRLGAAKGTVNYWLSGQRTPTGHYERELNKLIAQAALIRAGRDPGANQEELVDMVNKIVATTNPPTDPEASPEQRAYDAGRREATELFLTTFVEALWQRQAEDPRYTPDPTRKYTKKKEQDE